MKQSFYYEHQDKPLEAMAGDVRNSIYELTPALKKELSLQDQTQFTELTNKLLKFFDDLGL